jgi:hypothetical protein
MDMESVHSELGKELLYPIYRNFFCDNETGTQAYGKTLRPFRGKGPHLLLWPGPRAARVNVIVIGIPNCLNYCKIFIIYT